MRLGTILLVFLISGCATKYVPPESGETANLILPVEYSEWSLIGGYTAEKVVFGIGDEDNCADFFDTIPPAKEGDQEATVKIPGESSIFIIYVSNNRYGNCTAQTAFKAETDSIYKIKKLSGNRGCGINVEEVLGNDETKETPLYQLTYPTLVGKPCVKL